MGSGMETVQIRDPGWKKVRSGINIPDPQHCFLSFKFLIVVGSRHFNFSLHKDIYFLVSHSKRFLCFATNRKTVPCPCKRKVKNYRQLHEAEMDPAKNSLGFVESWIRIRNCIRIRMSQSRPWIRQVAMADYLCEVLPAHSFGGLSWQVNSASIQWVQIKLKQRKEEQIVYIPWTCKLHYKHCI